MIVINKYLVPKGYAAITIYPFIIFRDKKYMTDHIVRHETIHIKQQKEMLVLPFYLWYGIEYLIRLIQYKNKFEAYKNISFEREAYDNEGKLDYLSKRGLYSWFKYLME